MRSMFCLGIKGIFYIEEKCKDESDDEIDIFTEERAGDVKMMD